MDQSKSVVIFDEAHNIDDICIEAFTLKVNRIILDSAQANLEKLKNKVEFIKETDINRLDQEY